jgi:hypothetical protein
MKLNHVSAVVGEHVFHVNTPDRVSEYEQRLTRPDHSVLAKHGKGLDLLLLSVGRLVCSPVSSDKLLDSTDKVTGIDCCVLSQSFDVEHDILQTG